MKTKLKHGELVLVLNTLNYDGRQGVLGPISNDPEDIWSFNVELLASIENTPLAKARTIGVTEDQVVPLSLFGVSSVKKQRIIDGLTVEGLRNVIAEALIELNKQSIHSSAFLELKLTIQTALYAWGENCSRT